MKILLSPGSYVVAVSGGVDSMVLLHLLREHPGVRLTVAHFDHGIRPDSHEDRLLVQKAANEYSLPFVYQEGNLGVKVSEAQARDARYEFLHAVRRAAKVDALITAHHRDDVLETAVINMVRGRSRKGLASVQSTDIVKRPLLHLSKDELVDYARKHNLKWREDSTNTDPTYLRNHIRHNVLTRLSPVDKQKLHDYVVATQNLNSEIDQLLADFLNVHTKDGKLERSSFIMLPHSISLEVMATWLRSHQIRTFDKKMLERLTRGAKIHKVGSQIPVNNTVFLRISKEYLALVSMER